MTNHFTSASSQKVVSQVTFIWPFVSSHFYSAAIITNFLCQAKNEVLKVAGDSWMIYSTACRQDGGQHRAGLIWHTRGRSICNIHMHIHACTCTHTVSLSVTQSQVARRLTSSKGHNRAKARGTTGAEHLIMSASAVFVTQTPGQCYWGPGRNTQCKLCTPTPLWCLDRKES